MTASILVVEDEAIIARDIRATLKGLGYTALPPVASADAALQAVSAGAPDLVLMDIRIQGEADGIEAAGHIRELYGTPVVYLTSHSDETTISRAKFTGAYGYVLKPFSDRELRIAIEVALQKRAIEVRLRERERWFATTLRSIGDAVIATDAEQRITFMNAVAERVTGFSVDEADGRPLGEVFRLVDSATGAPLESPLDRAFREGFAVELPRGAGLATRGGRHVAVDDTAAPIVDDDGKTLGGVVVFRDVTERRQLERRLAQNERLAAIGTLSSGMAHEINNPLAYVLANVTFAIEHLGEIGQVVQALSGPEAAALAAGLARVGEALRDAHDGSMRVHRVVHELKKFARSDATEQAVLELTDVLEGAIRLTETVLRHQARVRREYRTTPFVEANEGQLSQVFVNLLVNAAQALLERKGEDDQVTIATYTDDAGRAVAEVRDSGPGIPPEVQRRIFDPFFTTKPVGQGTGLGLSIAQAIVAALGGELSVESKVGVGSTFRVALPPAKGRERPKRPPAASAPAPARRGRVLIIDDEPAIGRALIRVLERDHDVYFLDDARAALDRVAAGETFDVIFCDLMMPKMNGMDFHEALREGSPALARRVVFVTGGAVTPQANAFLQSSSNATLVKPVDPAALRRIVADYLTVHPQA